MLSRLALETSSASSSPATRRMRVLSDLTASEKEIVCVEKQSTHALSVPLNSATGPRERASAPGRRFRPLWHAVPEGAVVV